jgi:tRNA threonylcarbamoyl adenosine modification protein (Sua5/YciO/YrdC/YwlC family)
VIPDPLGEAADRLRAGGLLAYPTETVWGLGADARSPSALARLRAWKGRGDEAPIAILVADAAALAGAGIECGRAATRLIEAFWPGPLTLVLPCRTRFAPGVARADGAVGVRCSAHPLARALARRLAREDVGPITATSLNRSGEPPARDRAPRLLGVERAEAGGDAPSTVVDLTGPAPRVLRAGALSAEDLAPLLAEIAAA